MTYHHVSAGVAKLKLRKYTYLHCITNIQPGREWRRRVNVLYWSSCSPLFRVNKPL